MDSFARTLLIDTSGRIGRVALADSGQVVAVAELAESRRHARDLTMRMQEMLSARGWSARDLTALVVSIGPGSFTGLRVGIATAKALVYASNCELFGVPSFDAIAQGVDGGDFELRIVGDALQGMIYVGSYRWLANAGWTTSAPLAIVNAREWLGQHNATTRVAGPGLNVIEPLLGDHATLLKSKTESSPMDLLRTVLERADQYRISAWVIEPLYLRGSSAEEKRKRESEIPPASRGL